MRKGFAFYFQYNGKAPADLSRRMTQCDLHVKKITLTAGQKMKTGARLDVKEGKEATTVR